MIRSLTIGLAMASSLALNAIASENSGSSSSELSLADILNLPVVTASKFEQKVLETPAKIVVVTRETIERRKYRSLVDLLEDIPGFDVQRNSHAESTNGITVRGLFGVEKFIIMQDGIRISSITGSPNAVGNNFPVIQAERVEVLFGPASALYGADAFGGVINIITKKPKDVDGFVGDASYGSFDTVRADFQYGKEIGELGIFAYATFDKTDGPDLPSAYPYDFRWFTDNYSKTGEMINGSNLTTHTDILPFSVSSKANTQGLKTKLGDFQFGVNRSYEEHSAALGTRPEESLYADHSKWKTEILTVYGEFARNLSSEWRTQTTISLGSYEVKPTSQYINVYTNYDVNGNGYKYELGKMMKVEEQLTYHPTDKTSVVLGATYEDASSLPKTTDLPKPFETSRAVNDQSMTYAGTNVAVDLFPIWYQNYGVYAQVQHKLVPWLNVNAGTRYDYSSRYRGTVNPRLGLVSSPNDSLVMRLLYGEAYLQPAPYHAFEHYGAFFDSVPTSGFFNIPNSGLRPEKLRSAEYGLNAVLSKNFYLSTDVYFTRISNLTTLSDAFSTVFKGVNITATQPTNLGTETLYGGAAQLDMEWYAGAVKFRPYLGYAWTGGNVDGFALSSVSRNTGKIGLETKWKNFSLSPRILARSSSWVATRSLHPVEVPGSVVSNLTATVDSLPSFFGENKTSAYVRVQNLLNRRYFAPEWLATADNLSYWFTGAPQDPVLVEVGISTAL